ncbi:nucleotidyltransferase family protein [Desulfovibrio sp. OttesenSCG-928-F20]|nr:nucleotidyltransferase family protein [Desulfovibrio sp. OttesenSCG-928-F20]
MEKHALTACPNSRIFTKRKVAVMRPSEILKKHRTEVIEIFNRYPMISNIRLVGSVARGDDTEASDIDFLVDTAPGTSLFDIGGLREDLEDLLGISVDIIASGPNLHKYMQILIDKEARPL